MSQSCLTFALPPLVNHAWLYLATISQSQINYFFATISQTWLTFALPPSVRHGWLSLPPSVRHGWLLATISQTRRTPCHRQSDTADFALPPMSRTPCPVVTNVLDIQHLHLRALYTVNFSWMNIAVCKQVSGSLSLDIVCIWKLTQSWTLYHLCDAISIAIKQMSLSHHMWHICWCGRKSIIMFPWSVATLNWLFFLCPILLFVLSRNKYFTSRLNSNVFGNHADDGELIQSGIFVENKFSG